MIKLYEILKSCIYKNVEDELKNIYPEEIQELSNYKKVFFELLQKTPSTNKGKWKILIEKNEEENECFYSVYGKKPNDKDHYSLDFTSWDEWLGMNIDNNTLKNLTKEQIVAVCLWAMTYLAFSEEDINSFVEMIKTKLDEAEESIQKGELIPWEEVKKRLEEKINKNKE